MRQVRGAVIIPGAEGEQLRRLDISDAQFSHSPNDWAILMNWDLLTGRHIHSEDLIDSYEVILVNGNVECYDLLLNLKYYTPAKIILLEEGSRSSFSTASMKERIWYLKILNAIDAIGTLSQECNFFRLFSDKFVGWLGVPFDVSFVRSFSTLLGSRNHNLWGIGSRLQSHNSLTSLAIAKKAGISQLLMQMFPMEDDKDVKTFCNVYNYLSSIRLHIPYPWQKFLKIYSACWGAVSMSNEYTWGRYSLDFATLGIPVVGSFRQFTQNILFPSLCFEPYLETSNAVEVTKKLMADKSFYQTVINYAQNQLDIFDLTASKKRMEDFLEEIL